MKVWWFSFQDDNIDNFAQFSNILPGGDVPVPIVSSNKSISKYDTVLSHSEF